METSNNTQRRFWLVISIIVALGVLIGSFYLIGTPESFSIKDLEKEEITEADKLKILTELANSTPADATIQSERLKILQGLAQNASADPTSLEERLQILQTLASTANR